VLVVLGGVLGAGIMFATTYIYILDNPASMERIVVNKITSAFSKALTFEGRRKVYAKLPEINVPVPSSPPKEWNTALWAKAVSDALDEAESSWILMARASMRKELLQEALKFPHAADKLHAVREVLPASVERNVLVQDVLDDELAKTGWLDAALLEANPPATELDSADIRTRILVSAVSYFPGAVNRLVQFLEDPSLISVFAQEPKHVQTALESLLRVYRDAIDSDKTREFTLQRALQTTIDVLPTLSDMGPWQLYVRAIEDDLLGPLARDARVTPDILFQVKAVFLALPSEIQARILLRALRHPLARATSVTADEQAVVVRDLLSSGGVVSVKLGQVLAEDPKVPMSYRRLLGSLRDSNEPMSVAAFWHAIPRSLRRRITKLGPCLGVGSVKQVHKAMFDDGSVCAVAVLRANVEEEALASLTALEVSEDVGVVSKRLGRLVYGEFNLFGEGEALAEFASTKIGRHRLFRVVGVHHHSPKCLVEEIAEGPTLAAMLDCPLPANAPRAVVQRRERTKQLLTEYHRTVFDAFVSDGLIHSDIHLGNAVVQDLPSGELGLVLFDVGQWERIGFADTKGLLWVLSAISTLERRVALRDVALSSLAEVSGLAFDAPGQPLRARLELAFSDAIKPFDDGTVPDQRQAYFLFLRACERHGVNLPKGAFAVAKMLDSMTSQTVQLGLPNVIEDAIEGFLRRHLTWTETASLLRGSIRAKF